MKVLIVEDNALLGASLKLGLEERGFTVDLARDGDEGLYCAQNSDYHVLLVDSLLPKRSGPALIAALRRGGSHVPAILVTACGGLADRVTGLEQGADDYLVKPFELEELVARVNALHRRSLGRGDSRLALGALVLDLSARSAASGGAPLPLTGKEFDLLAALSARPGRVFGRAELLGLLYELNEEPESNSLDVLLARLRRKLNGAGAGVEIATVRGRGFVFRVERPVA